jgi:hypothetical protein
VTDFHAPLTPAQIVALGPLGGLPLALRRALSGSLLPRVPLTDIEVENRINENSGKLQLFTPHILAHLTRRLPADAFALAAVTAVALYPDEAWNFVFGQASLRTRVGVFSFARYDPAFFDEPRSPGDDALILRRMLEVLIHEVGHMFGLRQRCRRVDAHRRMDRGRWRLHGHDYKAHAGRAAVRE